MNLEVLKILLVDDSKVVHSIVKRTLEDTDLKISFLDAYSLTEALDLIENHSVDLIFLDLELPDSRGVLTYNQMSQSCHKTPIIILSGTENDKTALDLIKKGAKGYILKQKVKKETLEKTINHALEFQSLEGKISEVNFEEDQINITLIDDAPVVKSIVMHCLSQSNLNFHLDSFLNLREGLEFLESNKSNLILLDLNLPDSEGLKTLEKVSQSFKLIPIIVLTGTGDKDSAIEAIKMGAQDYVVKEQLKDKVLVKSVVYAIERNRITREKEKLNLQLQEMTLTIEQKFMETMILKEELNELNEEKNRFLGVAAHDLRSPLAFIQMTSNLLGQGMMGELGKVQKEHIGKIMKTSDTMLGLVNNLLDVSVIESGNLKMDLVETDLIEFIKEIHEVNSLLAKTKNIQLELDVPSDRLVVKIDNSGIQQVLNNLITNAVKFSNKNTRITITLIKIENGCKLSVIDEGQGIPQNEIDKLFIPFEKTSVRSTAGEKSTGLGLSIVKKIVEAHGGKIWAESEVGKGTVFTFTLISNI
ncbi:hypothetical protein BVY03_01160 [bacterium K02(2017)]|nr:hypothetical protein BVY03_01160 [bacterium K02(2017)]